MPSQSNSETIDALRSFLPERRLIRAKDTDALSLKYEAQRTRSLSDRLSILMGIDDMGEEDGREVNFKGLSLEIGATSPLEGSDPKSDVVVHYDSTDAMMLHVDTKKGFQNIRKRLHKIGKYILKHEDALNTPYVMGVTYAEMARVGMALGMRHLEIHDISAKYEADIRARHAVTFADARRPREFKPAAVYLPTNEFIERFTEVSK